MALPVRSSATTQDFLLETRDHRNTSPTSPDSNNASAPLNALASSIAPVTSRPTNISSPSSALDASTASVTQASPQTTNIFNTTSTLDASIAAVAHTTSPYTNTQAQPAAPMTKSTMYAATINSSPLSSPISPTSTPSGVWYTNTAPTDKSGSLFSTDTSSAMCKATIAPDSPGSNKSTGSNTSKKRSRADFDEDSAPDVEKAPKQRKKGAASKKAAALKKPTAPKKSNKPDKPALPASTRPARERKVPDRYVAGQDMPKKPAAPRKVPVGSKTWQAKHVTESYQSRLCKVDVYHMLLKDEVWTCLSLDQKRELFTMLPTTTTNERLLGEIESGKADATVRPLELKINCSEFRTDVATYLNELRDGYMSRRWQEDAHKAMVERAKGTFDDWKDEESETWWGQK